MGEPPLHRGRLGFQFTQPAWQQREDANPSQQRLNTAGLIQPQHTANQAQKAGAHENRLHCQPTPEIALAFPRRTLIFNVRSGRFKQMRIVHTRRAGGRTGETAEAIIHFIRKRPVHGHFPIRNRTHPGDPTARAVSFHLGGHIRGAGGQTHSAMHALLQDGIVHALQAKAGLGSTHQSKIFPGFNSPLGSSVAFTFFSRA